MGIPITCYFCGRIIYDNPNIVGDNSAVRKIEKIEVACCNCSSEHKFTVGMENKSCILPPAVIVRNDGEDLFDTGGG